MIGKAVTFAYPNFNKTFDIYTDSYDKQLGGVITQKGGSLAFYSCKLRGVQLNYTVTAKGTTRSCRNPEGILTNPSWPQNKGVHRP